LNIPPGEGAVEFTRCLIGGLNRSAAALVVSRLLTLDDGELAETYGKRVKRCRVCNYPFTDRTKARMVVVCGDQCRTVKNSAQTQTRRISKKRDVKPVRKSIIYVWWLEYPFYTPHEAMVNHVGSYERPFGNIEAIQSAKERNEATGGRRGRRNRREKSEY
jgi:hypothetical protein